MTSVQQPADVKGWCPGALKPMESGDGLLVRVRPRCGAFSLHSLAELAALASRTGNGHLDLTRRANIQIRGVRRGGLADVWSCLDRLGLIDGNAEAEAIRNVLVSPLAGLDPAEVLDVRPIARALEDALADTPALCALPGKFGFIVDGGGVLPLDGERGDIRLQAVASSGAAEIAIGIDRPDGPAWLRLVRPQDAAAAALRLAAAFLEAPRPDRRARMRDVPESAIDDLRSAIEMFGKPAGGFILSDASRRRPLGAVTHSGRSIAVGVAAPFGRIEASALRSICEAARDCGVREARVSPWRALYFAAAGEDVARTLLATAARFGFITDADDPLLAIDACPGAPACRSTALDTRAAAYQLAPMLAGLGCTSAHISGCAKGCARSRSADLVLVGKGGCFGIIRHDTAQALPRVFLPAAHLRRLWQHLRSV